MNATITITVSDEHGEQLMVIRVPAKLERITIEGDVTPSAPLVFAALAEASKAYAAQ